MEGLIIANFMITYFFTLKQSWAILCQLDLILNFKLCKLTKKIINFIKFNNGKIIVKNIMKKIISIFDGYNLINHFGFYAKTF